MNILDMPRTSLIDGEGVRLLLFVTGCDHYCKGCHNPESWDKNHGIVLTDIIYDKIFEIFEKRKRMIDGITLSGGDPLYVNNRHMVLRIVRDFKRRFPMLTIWLYTGFTWEEIIEEYSMFAIASYVDVIVDGEFKESLKGGCKYRGSSNQRIINVQESIKQKKVVEINEL